jgi:hypothetical protein
MPTRLVPSDSRCEPQATWDLTELDRANHFLVLRGTWLPRAAS